MSGGTGAGTAPEAPTSKLFRPSGGFRIEAVFLVPGAACAAAALLFPVYSAEAALVPLVFVNVLAAAAYGAAAGILSGWSVTASHARSPFLAAALAALGGSAGFFLSLAGWTGALFGPGADGEAGFLGMADAALRSASRIAADPSELVSLAFSGAPANWIFMGLAPSGVWAAAVWALQWIAFAAGICVPAAALASRPYSEEGGVWLAGVRGSAGRFALPDGAAFPPEALVQDVRSGNLEYFMAARIAPVGVACLELRILMHEKAPNAAGTVKVLPPKGRSAGGATIVKNVLFPREEAERIAGRG
ncbi:MAG: hypothetical protein LBQ79_06580 [Deltaproteobacteria bacterium]|jgi:hypothetical protein|nr:hypothetical protein [Deltaproteobacteria bacterium]